MSSHQQTAVDTAAAWRDTHDTHGHLRRVLGVAFGIAAVVGTCIGQGILRSPGVVADGIRRPALILLLWTAGGLFAAIDAMSTVELASSIRQSGGPYASSRLRSAAPPHAPTLAGLIVAVVVNSALLGGFLYESPLTALQATALIIVETGAVYVLTRRSAAPPATPAFDASA